jgi:hypothetical protein
MEWSREVAEALRMAQLQDEIWGRLLISAKDFDARFPMPTRKDKTMDYEDVKQLYANYVEIFGPRGRPASDKRPLIMDHVYADSVVLTKPTNPPEKFDVANAFATVVEERGFRHIRKLFASRTLTDSVISALDILWSVCQRSRSLEILSLVEGPVNAEYYKAVDSNRSAGDRAFFGEKLEHLEISEWMLPILGVTEKSLFKNLRHLVLHVYPVMRPFTEDSVVPLRRNWKTIAPDLAHFSIVNHVPRGDIEDDAGSGYRWPEFTDFVLSSNLQSYELVRNTEPFRFTPPLLRQIDAEATRELLLHLTASGHSATLKCLSFDLEGDYNTPALNPVDWPKLQKIRVRRTYVLLDMLKRWQGRKIDTCCVLDGVSTILKDGILRLADWLPELSTHVSALIVRDEIEFDEYRNGIRYAKLDAPLDPYSEMHYVTQLERGLSERFGIEVIFQSPDQVAKFPNNIYV